MMKKTFVSLLVAFLTLALMAAPALAFPPLPSSVYGELLVNGAVVAQGTRVEALINGVMVAFTTSRLLENGKSVYMLDVPGDDVSSPEDEGGSAGDTVQFRIGNLMASQTIDWRSGTNRQLDLTASGQANQPPRVFADAYAVNEDATLSIAAPGVLANDADDEGNPMTAARVSGPAHGTLSFQPNGSFVYVPAANFNGQDQFTYKANDGNTDSGTAIVTLTVRPVNDAPVASDGSFAVGPSRTIQIDLSTLVEDLETGGTFLTFTLVRDPAHGTLVQNGRLWTYTPAPDFTETDTFTFTARDRGDPDGCTGAAPACSAPRVSAIATVSVSAGDIYLYLPIAEH